MSSVEENNIVSDKVRVKNEPIDIEMQTSKYQKEVNVKAEEEEKFSATEEFANKISIAFLSAEETTETSNDNHATTINNKTNKSK